MHWRPTSADLVSSRIAMLKPQMIQTSNSCRNRIGRAQVPPGNKGIAFVSYKDPNNASSPEQLWKEGGPSTSVNLLNRLSAIAMPAVTLRTSISSVQKIQKRE